jgi:hypothetical protein
MLQQCILIRGMVFTGWTMLAGCDTIIGCTLFCGCDVFFGPILRGSGSWKKGCVLLNHHACDQGLKNPSCRFGDVPSQDRRFATEVG